MTLPTLLLFVNICFHFKLEHSNYLHSYLGNGDAARQTMDDLTYNYKSNTNQLLQVTDVAADVGIIDYSKYNDIQQGQQADNYSYDEIGNLTHDTKENISNIEWTVYGKISKITKTDGSTSSYTYDASGNRNSKTVVPATGGIGEVTWYVRDATGNVLSVYTNGNTKVNSGRLTQSEIHLFGSSRCKHERIEQLQ